MFVASALLIWDSNRDECTIAAALLSSHGKAAISDLQRPRACIQALWSKM
jgi:hypothetical protein